ncbi:MAG: M48 family metalloprotease [Chloroflexi bacterium]|nr:M48 family metalloprotease [Chloroflexota bacterium]
MGLQMRLYLLLAVMFGILYAVITVIASLMGIGGFLTYGILAMVMVLIQYMVGPSIVGWSMKVQYVSENEYPELHQMVSELAQEARLPKPKVGISRIEIPNAFAFGRWKGDARVCVTQGIMGLLSKDELRAVLGHEISHVKHRDMALITILSVIPLILWYVAWSTMFSGYGNRERGGNLAYIGIFAFLLYFITNLLVLYASRIREYYADQGSVRLGSQPRYLATALYKLVYGSARVSKESLKEVEGVKAFFASDPSRAWQEIKELREIDADMSGTIDADELMALRSKSLRLGTSDKMMELMSTHPNMLKRIKHLSSLIGQY